MLINGPPNAAKWSYDLGECALSRYPLWARLAINLSANLVDPAAVAPVAVVHPLQLDAVPLLAAVHRRLLVLQVPAAATRSPELTFSAQKATLVKPINAYGQLG